VTIHPSHAADLLTGLRDGRMTTHFNPVFTVKVLLEGIVNLLLSPTEYDILRS
jgi:hypothetical protein